MSAAGNILYVGKAKNLSNRVRNYTRVATLSPKIQKMVQLAVEVRFEVLESELEALLIEAELIHVHQPPYNTLLKDDKSPLYLCVTKQLYPSIVRLRKNDLVKNPPNGIILGPFQSSYKLNEVLRIARRIFPWCNQGLDSYPSPKIKPKACFYKHLELCPGACTGSISPEIYTANIQNLILFLRGKKKTVVKSIIDQMKAAAENEHFELAAVFKKQVELIAEVTSSSYRLSPDLVLPTFQLAQNQAALMQLKKIINEYASLPKTLDFNRIEGYDVSNNQGKAADVSMVVFTDGQPDTSEYRLFNIKEIDTPNDYQMLKEAILRRQQHVDWPAPDLVVIDGGKGQLKSAFTAWLTFRPFLISIAKDPDRLIIPLISRGVIEDYKVIALPPTHPALKLVQQIRDESHRFAKKQHHRLLWKQKIAPKTSQVL